MTSQLELSRNPTPLVDRPQRLGILPTWSVWRERANWDLVRWPCTILAAAAIALVAALGPTVVVAALIPILAIVLPLGLFERHIRRRALARRSSLPAHRRP